MVAHQRREVGGDRAGAAIDDGVRHRAAAQPVVARTGAPARHELPDRLAVPAGLLALEAVRERVERELAGFLAAEVFRLDLERIGPFHHCIGDPEPAAAGEGLDHVRAGGVDLVEGAVAGRGAQVGEPGAPRGGAEVAAQMREQGAGGRAVLLRVAAREGAPAPRLGAELDEQVGRRDPAQLHAVVVEPPAEERAVGERRVDEVPGVLVDLVLVADAGEEAPGLEREAAPERERLDERLLDLELVLGGQRGDQPAAEIRVDVAGQDKLALGEAEAAPRRADLAAGRREAADLVGFGVLRAARKRALQDDGHGWIEGIARCLRVRRDCGRGERHGADGAEHGLLLCKLNRYGLDFRGERAGLAKGESRRGSAVLGGRARRTAWTGARGLAAWPPCR